MGIDGDLMLYRGDRSVENLAEEFELLIKNQIQKNKEYTEKKTKKIVHAPNYIFLSNGLVNLNFDFLENPDNKKYQEVNVEIYEEEYNVEVDFSVDTSVSGNHCIYLLAIIHDYILDNIDYDLSLTEIEGTPVLVYRKRKLYLNRTHSKKYGNIYPFEIFDDFPSFDVELLQEDIHRENAKT